MGGFFKNDCGCGNDCTWLIILLIILFCCGDNKGGCGFSGGGDCCWIILIICCCGCGNTGNGHNGCGNDCGC